MSGFRMQGERPGIISPWKRMSHPWADVQEVTTLINGTVSYLVDVLNVSPGVPGIFKGWFVTGDLSNYMSLGGATIYVDGNPGISLDGISGANGLAWGAQPINRQMLGWRFPIVFQKSLRISFNVYTRTGTPTVHVLWSPCANFRKHAYLLNDCIGWNSGERESLEFLDYAFSGPGLQRNQINEAGPRSIILAAPGSKKRGCVSPITITDSGAGITQIDTKLTIDSMPPMYKYGGGPFAFVGYSCVIPPTYFFDNWRWDLNYVSGNHTVSGGFVSYTSS